MTIGRRTFITSAAAVAAAATTQKAVGQTPAQAKPLPAYVAWKEPNSFIVHSEQTLEMIREAFGTGLLTPENKLYIRNNIKAPPESFVADRDAWTLSIEGVRQPKTLTLADLKTMGVVSLPAVLQCSGNGRKYFMDKATADQKISGTPWTVGAAGCVIWTGVPLSTVVQALGGPADGVRFITGTGGEELPAGIDPRTLIVERSVPISTLENILLAWDINGQPMSLAHGGPLRMVVPGYSGVNSVKYVKKLALSATETDARIQAANYRFHAVGERPAPTQPPVWEQPVKSWITTPLKSAKPGRVMITGVAFGGMNAVAGVEVSVDGGKTWRKAEFYGPDLGRFAWRTFSLAADLPTGTHELMSRATDSRGNVQPEETSLNGSGYGHNGWRGPAIRLAVG